MDIQQRVAKIEQATHNMDSVADKTEQALSLAHKNEEDIAKMKNTLQWVIRTSVGAIITVVTGLITIWLGGH